MHEHVIEFRPFKHTINNYSPAILHLFAHQLFLEAEDPAVIEACPKEAQWPHHPIRLASISFHQEHQVGTSKKQKILLRQLDSVHGKEIICRHSH